jgi:hypothetical protein
MVAQAARSTRPPACFSKNVGRNDSGGGSVMPTDTSVLRSSCAGFAPPTPKSELAELSCHLTEVRKATSMAACSIDCVKLKAVKHVSSE